RRLVYLGLLSATKCAALLRYGGIISRRSWALATLSIRLILGRIASMKKMAAVAMAMIVFATSSAHAAVLQLSTSATDPNAGNSLSLNLNDAGSMFVWVSTEAGQTITGLSLDILSDDASVLEGTDHITENPNNRWNNPPGRGTLGDLVTSTNAFVFAGQTGISTADQNTFVLHSEIQFDATAVGSTNLQIARGEFDITEGAGFDPIPDADITFGTGIVNVAVPEPGSLGIIGLGLAASLVRRRRRA
ncbi:MAG: PEP-CTERM sorting domain-containing protein, partial [Planctomycetota bacterium]